MGNDQNKIVNYITQTHFKFVTGEKKQLLEWYIHNLQGNNLLNEKVIKKRIKRIKREQKKIGV